MRRLQQKNRQTPAATTCNHGEKAAQAERTRDASERTAHISASPKADVKPMAGNLQRTPFAFSLFHFRTPAQICLPGDAESDWLEAKRQLLAEARR